MSNTELPNFTIKQLLEAGVHFGHKTMRRNPKMAKYIHTNSNGISIINLNKTASLLYKSLATVKEIAKNNGRILFIATKKQAIEPVAEAAKRCGQYYVNFRWLGGMLTNWKTVSQSIKTLKKITEQLADPESDLNKKEKLVLERQRIKLEQALGGIKDMGGYPDLVFVIDTNKESLAIAEAKKLGVPIMAILDTNCNPDGISLPIPGNDDSAKAIKLYCRLISDAAIAGVKENMAISGIDISKFEGDELPDIAGYKTSIAEKSEKKFDKDSKFKKDFKGKRDFDKKSEKKAEVIKTADAEEKSAEKKPAAKKPAAKKPAAKK
ncbi:MAG: 30S ribosomal protein S2 [Rickettsiales bacterium]|nr:30S ribosomal protein S2 [Rickettsiales bacterium]